MELNKHYNLTVGLRTREVRGIIHGNQQELESDIAIEMLHTMDDKSKSHGVQILQKYVDAINELQKKNNPDGKNNQKVCLVCLSIRIKI